MFLQHIIDNSNIAIDIANIFDENKKDTFMLFKYILDTNTMDEDWKMYYNNEIFSEVDDEIVGILKRSGYDPTEDIMY